MTLAAMQASVSTDGSGREKPSVYLRPMAQPISIRPATNRIAHAMTDPPDKAGSSPRTMRQGEVVLPARIWGRLAQPATGRIVLDYAQFPCQTLGPCPTLP